MSSEMIQSVFGQVDLTGLTDSQRLEMEKYAKDVMNYISTEAPRHRSDSLSSMSPVPKPTYKERKLEAQREAQKRPRSPSVPNLLSQPPKDAIASPIAGRQSPPPSQDVTITIVEKYEAPLPVVNDHVTLPANADQVKEAVKNIDQNRSSWWEKALTFLGKVVKGAAAILGEIGLISTSIATFLAFNILAGSIMWACGKKDFVKFMDFLALFGTILLAQQCWTWGFSS